MTHTDFDITAEIKETMNIVVAWIVAAILIIAGWMIVPAPFAMIITIFVIAFLWGYLTHD